MCASARPFSAIGDLPCRSTPLASANNDLCLWAEPSQQPQHCRFAHGDAAGGRRKIVPRQMQKYRTAEARDARRGIVIDLDDEIVKVVVALEAVADLIAAKLDRPVVVAAGWIFAPGVLRSDRPNWQERQRTRVTVGAPPQSQRPKCPFRS